MFSLLITERIEFKMRKAQLQLIEEESISYSLPGDSSSSLATFVTKGIEIEESQYVCLVIYSHCSIFLTAILDICLRLPSPTTLTSSPLPLRYE